VFLSYYYEFRREHRQTYYPPGRERERTPPVATTPGNLLDVMQDRRFQLMHDPRFEFMQDPGVSALPPDPIRKVEIKYIEQEHSRKITYYRRRGGLVKKAAELAVLTGCQVAVHVFRGNDLEVYYDGDLTRFYQQLGMHGNPEERHLTPVYMPPEHQDRIKPTFEGPVLPPNVVVPLSNEEGHPTLPDMVEDHHQNQKKQQEKKEGGSQAPAPSLDDPTAINSKAAVDMQTAASPSNPGKRKRGPLYRSYEQLAGNPKQRRMGPGFAPTQQPQQTNYAMYKQQHMQQNMAPMYGMMPSPYGAPRMNGMTAQRGPVVLPHGLGLKALPQGVVNARMPPRMGAYLPKPIMPHVPSYTRAPQQQPQLQEREQQQPQAQQDHHEPLSAEKKSAP
jgi:hypothetical protein